MKSPEPHSHSPNPTEFLEKIKASRKTLEAAKQAHIHKQQERMRFAVEKAKLEHQLQEIESKQDLYKKLIERQVERFKRQEERARWKEETEQQLKKVIEQKPLYARYEEEFRIKHRDWEREAEVYLSRRALEKVSLSTDEITLHQQRHDELIELLQRQKERKRRESSLDREVNMLMMSPERSKTLGKILERERKDHEDACHKEKLAKERLLRKRTYSRIVNDYFKPVMRRSTASQTPIPVVEERKRVVKFKPRKFKPNPLAPKESPARQPIIRDYLAERRDSRNRAYSSALSNIDSLSRSPTSKRSNRSLLDVSKSLEARARSGDLLRSDVSMSIPALEFDSQVAQLYIDSIKAKLSYIESMNART
mmetsp:Transcript_26075/g.46307  ORF Transcript_26075/g.46307 Transcript_26075/m.46307 type:complete len:366 (-) Transcript_26075:2420-3517(-)